MSKRLTLAIFALSLCEVIILWLALSLAHAQVDLAALKVELDTDPKAMGLTQYTEKDSGTPAVLLNARTGVGAGPVPNDALTGATILVNLDPDEYIKLGQADALDIQRLQVLLTLASIGGQGINLGDTKALAIFVKLLSVSMPTTAANLSALATRQGSRAEVLFGTGVSVSSDDIVKAWRLK